MKKTLLCLAVLTASFSFAQVTIGSGTTVDTFGNSTPISNYFGYSVSQSIYLASEINAAGNITALDFQLNGSAPIGNSDDNIDVWIGHTTKSSYSPVISNTGADWIPVSGQTHVMTNGSLTRVGNTVTITFAQPFAYNGVDNLVITVDENEPEYDDNILYMQGPAAANKMSLSFRTDTPEINPDPQSLPLKYSGTVSGASVQAKNTRAVITMQGITSLGLAHNNANSAVVIYPNPVTSQLFFESATNVISADVYSVTGQLVRSGKIFNNSMNTADLPAGAYIVKAVTEEGVLTERFIKG